jgi:hypothetical protein
LCVVIDSMLNGVAQARNSGVHRRAQLRLSHMHRHIYDARRQTVTDFELS